jgi:hypothetical protein
MSNPEEASRLSKDIALEVAEFYRPLDAADKPWMEQLGCEWPEGGDAEQEWLLERNQQIEVGSEPQYGTQSPVRLVAYGARDKFLALLPVAQAAFLGYKESRDRQVTTPLPNTLIAMMRLLSSYDVNVGPYVSHAPTVVHVRCESAVESLHYLESRGLDSRKIVQNAGIYGSSLNIRPEVSRAKLNALQAIARAGGMPDYRQQVKNSLERNSRFLFGIPVHATRSLGRISLTLFDTESPLETLRAISYEQREAMISAYLARSGIIHSPSGLNLQARLIGKEYTQNELRGYIAQHTDDRVVREYLRGRPITEEELASFPQDGELRPPRQSTSWDVDPDPEKSYRLQGREINPGVIIRYARAQQTEDLTSEDLLGLQAAIADGVTAEDSLRDRPADKDQQEAINNGRQARQKLAALFLSRAIDRRFPAMKGWKDEAVARRPDEMQTEFVKLMMAIVNLGYRHEEERPKTIEDTWAFLKDQIQRTKLTLAEESEEDRPIYTPETPISEPDEEEPLNTHEQILALQQKFNSRR